MPLVEDGDAQGQPYRVVPVLFHLFAEAEVVAVGIGRTDAGAEAQARNVSGAGNLDVHVGGFYIQFARFDFGTQVEGALIDVILGRERYQHAAVVEWRQEKVHFEVAVEFQELLELQLVVLQGRLRSD